MAWWDRAALILDRNTSTRDGMEVELKGESPGYRWETVGRVGLNGQREQP
jgi:hypothetical protein